MVKPTQPKFEDFEEKVTKECGKNKYILKNCLAHSLHLFVCMTV
jgi:hypothetical protein